MFSPSTHEGGPATATRSRRRQRPQSTDSLVQPPKAKRQRLPLTEQTFVNPDAAPETYEVKQDGKVANFEARLDGYSVENPTQAPPRKELSVRAKKPKAADRATKGDGSILLTTNHAYTVHKLPALPDRIRSDAPLQQQGDIFPNGYALSLTHTHAIVWPYTAPSQSPETFTFTLPYPSKHATEPLPLGCLVSPSASSSEPGLVIVMPVSGKVTYWESISSAATLDFMRQQRHGVEGSVSGMFSGERVVQITNAESAGFILAFSSGRLAYMGVRDGHGRPMISVQILRTGLGSTAGGLFGSIRHALSHVASRGDIAAVRAEHGQRVGERNVVAATLKGKLHAWKIHRGGHHDTIAEAEVREDIYAAIQDIDPTTAEYGPDSFEVIDLTYIPKGMEPKYQGLSRLSDALASDDPSLQHLLLLVSLSKKKESHYSLVEVILSSSSTRIGMVRPLTSYRTRWTPVNPAQSIRPRVYLPRPGLVAFAIFDKSVVVASIGCPPESPESQLQEDNHILPPTYEDVLSLTDNHIAEIVGSGFEEPTTASSHDETRNHKHKTKNPAAVLMIRGTGVLRLTTTDIDRFASDKPPKVDAKSQLDQAVFFGDKQDTPLNFDGRRGVQFTDKEMSEAALQVSQEILSCSTPHISTVPASLEENLRLRCLALEKLMFHLKSLNVQLDRRTRWALLYHAEKMMVATLLWKRHETFTSERASDSKKDLVAEIVEFIHQNEKKVPNRAIGEVDRVRHWFIHDVDKLEIFVAWAYEVIKYMYKDRVLNDAGITRMIHEAVKVNLTALQTAVEFRRDKLAFYGLQNESLDHGILRAGYEELPEPWTGCNFICNNLKRLLELCHQWLEQYYPASKGKGQQPDAQLISKIVANVGPLTDSYLVSLLEQSRWASVQQDQKTEQWAEHCSKLYDTDRNDKVLALLRLDKWEECIQIAEKHRSWKALAVSLIEQIHSLRKETETTASKTDITAIQEKASEKEKQIGKFFDKYGEAFAFPAYEILLDNDSVHAVLDFAHDRHGYKTKFLRQRPELARISWINDIQGESDIDHAAETLLDLGMSREQQVWNKKIELSLGKLALMAETGEAEPAPGLFNFGRAKQTTKDEGRQEEQLEEIDNELEIIRIQDNLYKHVYPAVVTAVDDAAALELAMESHGLNIPRQQKALTQIFENGLRRLLKHEALDAHTLIDLLTLIALRPDAATEIDDPFYSALQVAEHALTGEEYKTATRLVWRRCYIRDDWVKLNDTQLKDDDEVREQLAETALFGVLMTCLQTQTVDRPFHLVRPGDVLGAYTDGLDRRFNDMDKPFKDKLVAAMKWEDTVLRKYIDKARLEKWARTASEDAEAIIRRVVDDETRAGAEANGAHENGEPTPSKKMNGVVNGTHRGGLR